MRRAGPGWSGAVAAVLLIACTFAAAAAPARGPLEQALNVRALEDLGAYGKAAAELRTLRGQVAPDADLEIELALNEARSGQLDSAAVRLQGPLLAAALMDTLPATRRVEYSADRAQLWLNGGFDGWSWYVARARAEVAATQGRWNEALEAARECTRARTLEGKEWLLVAVCAGNAGQIEEGADAAQRAAYLDPSLPEAHYVQGLYAWRAGRRAAAAARFAKAVALDSTYRDAALAHARARLPFGSVPDFPTALLIGDRAAGLLTSPVGPKLEDFAQMDTQASPLQPTTVVVPDSIRWKPPGSLALPVLIGAGGRILLQALPCFDRSLMPEEAVHLMNATLPTWSFKPATRLGTPRSIWTLMPVEFEAQTPEQAAAPPGDSR